MSDRPEWFAPKRYGYGAGMPIAWQGWALLVGFVALVFIASVVVHWSLAAYLSIVATLTVAFILVTMRTTRGGWRWRWGEDD